MTSEKTRTVVHRLYDEVNLALWATLVAFVVVFVSFLALELPQARAKIEAARVLKISAENRAYCEKWGMRAGTRAQAQCVLDLQELRARIRQRLVDETQF